jgi:hypothetical protein
VAIIEEKVKPERMENNREGYRRYWWQYAEKRHDLYEAIRGLDRVLVVSRVGQALAFAFCNTGSVFAESLVVLSSESFDMFALVQARAHETWARLLASSMKDDLRYTPSDCFETFPFPQNGRTNESLARVGQEYYEFRAGLMVRNNEGLTETYNRFHDPAERDANIVRLRELHDEMDRAVLDAYGWNNIRPVCEFLLDYEDDEEETPGKSGGKKKPWRYRWPDAVRDEVLGRLLVLNGRRAADEQPAASRRVPASKTPKQPRRRRGVGSLLD